MSFCPDDEDQLGSTDDGLAREFEVDPSDLQDEDQVGRGDEYEGEKGEDQKDDDVAQYSHQECKTVEFVFSVPITPRKLKDRYPGATLDRDIILVRADAPKELKYEGEDKKILILPKKVEVYDITNNFYKHVLLTFEGIKVPAYSRYAGNVTLEDAGVVVLGTSTPFVPSRVKHQVILDREVHADMKNFVKKFGEYTIDNLQTKGVEQSSTMTFVPGPNGWKDEKGVMHGKHPVYTIAKPLNKYAEDPMGRLMMPNDDFYKFSAMTSDVLQDHQQPMNLAALKIHGSTLYGDGTDWASLDNTTMPVANDSGIDKRFCISGRLRIEYH